MPRTKKAPKDLNAPKRPSSSYFLFAQKRRPSLRQENPSLKITEVAKRIAEEWKELTEDDKQVYVEEAKKLKEQYTEDLETYQKTDNYKEYLKRLQNFKEEQGNSKGKKGTTKIPKKPKDQHAPKRPPAGYFVYQNSRRSKIKEENPEFRIGDIAKKIGAEWQALSESERKPFEDEAKKLKEQYLIDLKKYQETDNYKEYQETLKQWKKACAEAKKPAKSKTKSKTKSKQDDSESESESGSEEGSSSGSGDSSDDSDASESSE